jgi:integrase/recombinase XerD
LILSTLEISKLQDISKVLFYVPLINNGGVLDFMKQGFKGTQKFKNLNYRERKKWSELADEFIRKSQIKGLSQATIKSYETHIRYFSFYLDEDVFCDEITVETMEDYIVYIKEVRRVTNGNSINSYIRNLSPIIKYGIKKGYITEDFQIPTVKVQETHKEIYSEIELNSLLDKPKKRDFVEIRTWAIIWTFASTGIRARELRELKVSNVDLFNRVITVNQTKNKKVRVLPISHSLLEVLTEFMDIRDGEGDDYLFCSVYNTQLAMSSLQKCIKRYCNARGVKKTSLHLFRHTFITNAVNNNISPLILKKITGHSTMKELNRYYNAKITDIVGIIDFIAPSSKKKESYFKKGSNK